MRPHAFLPVIALASTAFVVLLPGRSVRVGSISHSSAILAIPTSAFRFLIWTLRWAVNPATLELLLFALCQSKTNNSFHRFDPICWPSIVVGLAIAPIVLSPKSGTSFRVTKLLCFALLPLHCISAGLSVKGKYCAVCRLSAFCC